MRDRIQFEPLIAQAVGRGALAQTCRQGSVDWLPLPNLDLGPNSRRNRPRTPRLLPATPEAPQPLADMSPKSMGGNVIQHCRCCAIGPEHDLEQCRLR